MHATFDSKGGRFSLTHNNKLTLKSPVRLKSTNSLALGQTTLNHKSPNPNPKITCETQVSTSLGQTTLNHICPNQITCRTEVHDLAFNYKPITLLNVPYPKLPRRTQVHSTSSLEQTTLNIPYIH